MNNKEFKGHEFVTFSLLIVLRLKPQNLQKIDSSAVPTAKPNQEFKFVILVRSWFQLNKYKTNHSFFKDFKKSQPADFFRDTATVLIQEV